MTYDEATRECERLRFEHPHRARLVFAVRGASAGGYEVVAIHRLGERPRSGDLAGRNASARPGMTRDPLQSSAPPGFARR